MTILFVKFMHDITFVGDMHNDLYNKRTPNDTYHNDLTMDAHNKSNPRVCLYYPSLAFCLI